MVGFKVNGPLFRTSASVLAVMLMTSGAFAEDEVTAGTDAGAGLGYENDLSEDPDFLVDPIPDDLGEGVAWGDGDPGDGDPVDGSDDPVEYVVDEGGEIIITLAGGPSECGGCEYQFSAGPDLPLVQRAVSRVDRSTPVKNSCMDPERYVAWLCDWQKDAGLIGR